MFSETFLTSALNIFEFRYLIKKTCFNHYYRVTKIHIVLKRIKLVVEIGGNFVVLDLGHNRSSIKPKGNYVIRCFLIESQKERHSDKQHIL